MCAHAQTPVYFPVRVDVSVEGARGRHPGIATVCVQPWAWSGFGFQGIFSELRVLTCEEGNSGCMLRVHLRPPHGPGVAVYSPGPDVSEG